MNTRSKDVMAKRMVLMLTATLVFVGTLGFVKFKQIQTAIGQAAAFQPPPEAVTTIVAAQEAWPTTMSAIGTMAAVQGVTVSADLPGTVDRIAFDSGTWVREGEVLALLDTRQEQAQLAAAEAQRALARLDFERMQGLRDENVVDPTTRNVQVQATLSNPHGKLRPGMFVQTALMLGESSAVVSLPASSISYAPYGDSVFVVTDLKDPNGKAYRGVRQQFVKLGAS